MNSDCMTSNQLKTRMSKVLPKLDKFYLVNFLKQNSKYDSKNGLNKIEAVVGLKLGDQDLTEAFEKHVGI